MRISDSSVLIHCRNRYCDFPGKLFQYPEDFTLNQIYELRSMLLQTTESIEDLRKAQEKRKVIISTGSHLILGITAYLKDISKPAKSGSRKMAELYTDGGGRPVYGFLGFVWKIKDGVPERIAEGFPSPESFFRLLEAYILPRWELRYWEERRGAAYEEQVGFDRFSVFSAAEESEDSRYKANRDPIALKVYPKSMETVMLRETLLKAVHSKEPVSCCTRFPGLYSAGRSAFMNVTCAGRDDGRMLLKRRKRRNSSVSFYSKRL